MSEDNPYLREIAVSSGDDQSTKPIIMVCIQGEDETITPQMSDVGCVIAFHFFSKLHESTLSLHLPICQEMKISIMLGRKIPSHSYTKIESLTQSKIFKKQFSGLQPTLVINDMCTERSWRVLDEFDTTSSG